VSAGAEIKAAIARWVSGSLVPSESPRCPEYPKCGGEDGAGALQWPKHAAELRELGPWGGKANARWSARRAEIIDEAPRCDECMRFKRAVDRLLARFEADAKAVR
jgi:hypothetical protein